MIDRRTELADLLMEVRGTKNQADFQRELEGLIGLDEGKLGAKYVSLVETGVRKKLSPEFLQALEIKTGRPRAELIGMNQRSSAKVERRQTRTARIVSGHTTFASGLIGAALKGISQLEVATCAERVERAPKNWQPSVENARWIAFRDGGIAPMKDENFLKEIGDHKNTYYFSANDAIDALDAGWADLAAIPSALIEGRRNYVRLLRLVASDVACTLICGKQLAQLLLPDTETHSAIERGWQKEREIPVFDLTTKDLGDAIRRGIASSGASFRIGAEPRTIAEVVLEEAIGFASSANALEPTDILVPIASHNAATIDAKTMDSMRSLPMEAGEQELDGLLIWDPHASWIVEKMKKQDAAAHALISVSRSPNAATHRPRRFEFDLVTTAAKSASPELLRAARDWMFKIWDTSEELSLIKPTRHHGIVNALTSYFELGDNILDATTIKRASRVLGAVGYDVALKMEAFAMFESIPE